MTTVIDDTGTSSAAADTAPGTETNVPTGAETAATAANPGGAPGYQAVSYGQGGTANSTPQVPPGDMPTSMPVSAGQTSNPLEDEEMPESITNVAASAGEPVGYGQGDTAPNLTRMSDLVKLAAALNTMPSVTSLQGLNEATVRDVATQAHLSADDVRALMGLTGPTLNRQDQQAVANVLENPKTIKALNQSIWTDLMSHLKGIGVPVTGSVARLPNASNMMSKLDELGQTKLPQVTVMALQRAGYNTTGMTTVEQVVAGHDAQQFATGAPGLTTAIPATPATTQTQTATGGQLWDQFVQNWNHTWSSSEKANMMADLEAAGALDTSSGNPTVNQVADAYAEVMQSAQTSGVPVEQEVANLSGLTPEVLGPSGAMEPIGNISLDAAYVMHVAQQVLGPNAITPYQAQSIVNAAAKVGGSGSTAGEDLIYEAVANLYNTQSPTTTGSSYAALAYQAASDTLAQWGIEATPQVVGSIVGATGLTPGSESVLQTGVTTPYQITSLAASAAEAYAKTQASSLYGAGVASQIQAGNSLQQQASPYLQTAATYLGIPTSEMLLTDPKWTAWTSGGTGPGGVMTQQEWLQHLESTPEYNAAQAPGEVQGLQSGAGSILQLLGKIPSSGSAFSGATLPSSAIGG